MPSQLIELIPALCFFISYKIFDLYFATSTLVFTTICTTIFIYFKHRKISSVTIVSVILLLLFSILTVVTGNMTFIKMKPTFLYLTIAIVLFIDIIFLKKHFIKKLYITCNNITDLSSNIDIKLWRKVEIEWCCFLVLFSMSNEVVWRYTSESAWVNFKVFIMPVLIMCIIMMHIIMLSKHTKAKSQM